MLTADGALQRPGTASRRRMAERTALGRAVRQHGIASWLQIVPVVVGVLFEGAAQDPRSCGQEEDERRR